MEFPKSIIKKGQNVVGKNTTKPKYYPGPEPLNFDNMDKPKATFARAKVTDNSNISSMEEIDVRTELKEVINSTYKHDIIKEKEEYLKQKYKDTLTEEALKAKVAIELSYEGFITRETATGIITGLIRTMYILDLKDQGSSFGLDDLRYLDGLIFNDIRSIVDSMLKFGSSPYFIGVIIDIIITQSGNMDYRLDDKFYVAVKGILDQIW